MPDASTSPPPPLPQKRSHDPSSPLTTSPSPSKTPKLNPPSPSPSQDTLCESDYDNFIGKTPLVLADAVVDAAPAKTLRRTIKELLQRYPVIQEPMIRRLYQCIPDLKDEDVEEVLQDIRDAEPLVCGLWFV